MSRTIGTNIATEVAAAVTRPGYLVEIMFTSPVRVSSRGAFAWDGRDWTAWDLAIAGLGVDGGASSLDGSVTLGNADYSIGALVLAEGVSGRAVKVWKFYGETPAADDPVLLFSGVGNNATINPTRGTVQITLQQSAGKTLYAPRTYIGRAAGFNHLPARGTLITWNGETFRLEPAGD